MRTLAAFLLISFLTPCAISQEDSPVCRLSEEDQRRLVDQLLELEACRQTVQVYEHNAAQAKQACEEAIKAQSDRADLATEQARFYREQYKLLTKKPSAWCWIKRICTAFIHRCN